MRENNEYYIEAVKREIEKLEQGQFTGNIEFRPNFKDGAICNMNIGLNKSLKKID
jgi:hypothetical protein